jgi:hypothetical protein
MGSSQFVLEFRMREMIVYCMAYMYLVGIFVLSVPFIRCPFFTAVSLDTPRPAVLFCTLLIPLIHGLCAFVITVDNDIMVLIASIHISTYGGVLL